jgi:phosphoribosylaminoimidazole (AIR) synthetase
MLLEPHRTYLSVVQSLIAGARVTGMAHNTGGGLPGNVSRIILRRRLSALTEALESE